MKTQPTRSLARVAGDVVLLDRATGARVRGAPVELARTLIASDAPESDWNTIAYEVALKGRGDVKLTRADFESVVKNFGRYPKVAVVLDHADTDLSAHPDRSRARGWITAMRVGEFTRPGGRKVSSLEAKFTLDEPTRAAVNAEPPSWAFCSVTIIQRARDEETNEQLGTVLYSLSLTNNPALQGLDRIVAADERGSDVNPEPREITMRTYLALAALLGIAAATEEEAQEKIFASAKDLSAVRVALGLPASATLADVVAKVTTLSTEAAKVAGLEAKVEAFEAEKAERVEAERKMHVDAWIAVDPKSRETSRAALEAFARVDYAAFSKAYPMPKAADLKTAQAELSARAEDKYRLGRVVSANRGVVRDSTAAAETSADDIITTARALQHAAADRGEELSFTRATELAMSLTADDVVDGELDEEDEDLALEGAQ